MIHLDEERNVVKQPLRRGARRCARVPQARIGRGPIKRERISAVGRSAAAPRGRTAVRPYGVLAIAAVLLGAGTVLALAVRSGDWLLAVARAPGFAINPDLAEAVAGAEWLAPSIRGGSFGDAIGVAIVVLTVVTLVALRVWQHFGAGARRFAGDATGVYKIVTNQTNADDRRPVAWVGWTSQPLCERVKTLMCG